MEMEWEPLWSPLLLPCFPSFLVLEKLLCISDRWQTYLPSGRLENGLKADLLRPLSLSLEFAAPSSTAHTSYFSSAEIKLGITTS